MPAVRLIDAGAVPWLRSQALYHGLAHARTVDTPDTVVLAIPEEPYVCIGLHQDVEHEIDLEYCRAAGLPVLRRETGGGAVYIDSDQIFVQWILAPGRLPARVEERFALFARPLVAAYRDFGIDARFRPINDIHAGGRKICGTGAARIGEAEVLVGNFILDFDTDAMARVVRASSSAFRSAVRRGLELYMTSMRRELGTAPPVRDVLAAYRRRLAEVFDDGIADGSSTATEETAIEASCRKLDSEAFLHQPGGLRRPGLKIHEDVRVVESVVDVDRHRIRIVARMRENTVEDVSLSTEQP